MASDRDLRHYVGRDDLAPNAVAGWARATPEQVFLEHMDGRRLTYSDVDAELDRWASAFAARGLTANDHIAIFVTDPLTSALAWLAAGRAGLVAVPLNTAHVGRMLRHVLAQRRRSPRLSSRPTSSSGFQR